MNILNNDGSVNTTPLGVATEQAYNEVLRAKEIHGRGRNFASLHEGYGVLKEEVDELWDEIKEKIPNKQNIRKEAIQVAAMALRIASELTVKE